MLERIPLCFSISFEFPFSYRGAIGVDGLYFCLWRGQFVSYASDVEQFQGIGL